MQPTIKARRRAESGVLDEDTKNEPTLRFAAPASDSIRLLNHPVHAGAHRNAQDQFHANATPEKLETSKKIRFPIPEKLTENIAIQPRKHLSLRHLEYLSYFNNPLFFNDSATKSS
ncbi:MAG: hypothetical protein AAGD22_18325, partial [Verrucomicrobiota bacterium]